MRYSLFGRSSLFAQQYVLDHGLMMQWGFNKLVGGAVSKREALVYCERARKYAAASSYILSYYI